MKFFDSFRRSAAQLRDLRSLTGASLLLALSILLTYFFRLDFYSATIDNIILAPQDNETFIGIDSCDIIRL